MKAKKTFTKAVSCTVAAALSLGVCVSTSASAFVPDGTNNSVSKTALPNSADNAVLNWATKVGTGWTDSPSPVTIVGNDLVFTSGDKLMRMNKDTGVIDSTVGQRAGTNSYAIQPPTYADGMIFVGFDGGVQAFDAETLKSLWVYNDELGGQAVSPIYYNDGCIYTGFWSSGWSETDTKNYVCIDVKDEDPNSETEAKSAKWTYASEGGFYWAGAYANDNFVVVGTEDGKTGATSPAKAVTLDKETGKVLDSVDSIYGDVRSSVTYDAATDAYYFTSKGGHFYSVKIDDNGKFSDLKDLDLGAASTSTPTVVDGRAYVGVSGSGWGQYNGCGIDVIDLDSFEIAYKAETMGYPQTSGLASVNEDGYTYVYFVENTSPSEIRYVKDKKGVTEVVDAQTENGKTCAPVLFTPTGAQAQYAIADLVADDEGTIYFKNDSSYIMAIGAEVKNITVETAEGKTLYKEGESFDLAGMKVYAELANGVKKDITDKVTFDDSALSLDDTFVTLTYNYGLYKDTANKGEKTTAGVAVDPAEVTVDVNVLSEADYNSVDEVIKAIAGLGDITLDSEEAVNSARAAYEALGDLKVYVSNIDVLTAAEEKIEELKNSSSSEESSDSDKDSSSDSSSEVTSDSIADSDSTSSADSASNADSKTTSDASSSKAANSASSANPSTGMAKSLCFAGLTAVICGALAASKKRK